MFKAPVRSSKGLLRCTLNAVLILMGYKNLDDCFAVLKGCFAVCFLLIFSLGSLPCLAEGESSGDEITGGFRFASPGAGDQYRWKVEGDRARFISKDVIEISPVRAIVWSDKESEYLIKTDWARLDKTTKDIWTDSPVEIIKGNSKMTGVGLKWVTAKKRVTILKDVKMTLDLGEAKQWQFK